MKRIAVWKYPLELTTEQTLMVPRGWRCLSVQMQHGVITMWCGVFPDAEKQAVDIVLLGTGIDYGLRDDLGFMHLGTVQQGEYVWHFFHEYEHEHKEDDR